MRKFVSVWMAVLAVNVFMTGVAVGADLPKSGRFTIHSGWKGIGETTQVADNHIFWYGSFWGVTYNDTGEGLLHTGAVLCSGTQDLINGAGTGMGSCAWADGDGDKIFTDYSGSATPAAFSGLNQITGGTGKFVGIRGTAPFQCRMLNANGQATCKQQFEYRLP